MLGQMVHHDPTAAGRDSLPTRSGGAAVHVRTLTQMEQRVALLVVVGRTNAEVAAELGLSAKTVEWHLSRAFRKLGVRSRDELAAVLAPGTDEPLREAVE